MTEEVSKEKEYIAYQGTKFIIEWFFDENGKSQASEYFEELDLSNKAKFLSLLKWMGDTGQIRNEEKFRNEGDQIYAFKPKPHRFLCFFFQGGKIIITSAFEKKKDKLPPPEKEKALKCKASYEQRTKENNYYE
jgi:hypothetical protein